MENNYIIDITGKQFFNEEEDIIEVTTLGQYYEKSGKKYIVYREYDQEHPEDKRMSIVKVEPDNKITITRTGDYKSRLILEREKRHQCHYSTVAGDLMIGVFANKMRINLNDDGGVLEVGYTIDFNSDLVSENEFKIILKRKQSEKQ